LDVVNNETGEVSVFVEHDYSEIMFHVSTLLPDSKKDNQHLERKRHIGNDKVAIIFQDFDTPFSPKIIKSKLLHVFLIIQPVVVNNITESYKLSVISKKDVPYFGPYIRKPYVFKKNENLKRFILSKLINAEYASLRAPAFSTFSELTLEKSLKELCQNLVDLNRTFLIDEKPVSVKKLMKEAEINVSSKTSEKESEIEQIDEKSSLKQVENLQTEGDGLIRKKSKESKESSKSYKTVWHRLSHNVLNNFRSTNNAEKLVLEKVNLKETKVFIF
jgi:hypothetical protein